MKCKNGCGKETGSDRKHTCSDKCRQAYNRDRKSGRSVTKQEFTVTKCESVTEPERLLSQSMLDSLPVGVVRPTGQPNEKTEIMSGGNLNRSLLGVKVWKGTPEYAEVIYRLLTDDLEGLKLPVWKLAS